MQNPFDLKVGDRQILLPIVILSVEDDSGLGEGGVSTGEGDQIALPHPHVGLQGNKLHQRTVNHLQLEDSADRRWMAIGGHADVGPGSVRRGIVQLEDTALERWY